MLTYDTISRIAAQERESKTLVNLPEGFFEDAKLYIDNKSKLSTGNEDAWELDNAKRMLQDILEIRERKILTLSLHFVRSGVSPNNMVSEESEFFNNVVAVLKEFQNTKKLMIDGKPENYWTLAMLEDVPEFVGINMRRHGPYSKGDIASVPEEHGKLLVEKGMAKKLETQAERI